MGKSQSRSAGRVSDDRGRRARRREVRARENRSARFGVGMFFCVLTVLGAGPIATAPAGAQDPALKAEPPKQSTPLPAPPDAQKESTPLPAPPDAQKESAPASSEALSAKYLFRETYSSNEVPEKRYVVTQYRVGVVETQKWVGDNPKGAPDVSQWTRTTVYTERAAQVSRLGDMTDAVRHYDTVRTEGMPPPLHPPVPPFLQGLKIWYHRLPGEPPQILNLSGDRRLRESEYDAIGQEVFVPSLIAFLLGTPRRVGDTWEIPPKVVKLMWRETPSANDYEMTGSLIEVNKTASGTSLTAVIGVSGRFTLRDGPSAFNARIYFTFEPTPAVSPPDASPKAAESGTRTGAGKRDDGIIDARGSISHVLMAQRVDSLRPDSDDRLKQSLTHQLELWRKPLAVTTDAPAGGLNLSLSLPAPPPTADEANSWLLYDDPKGRFHLRHPQELQLSPRMIDPNILELVDRHLETGNDVFIVRLAPGAEDPQSDRLFRDVKQLERETDAFWAKGKVDIVRGPAGWLPEKDWEPLRVYRKELGVKAEGTDEKRKSVERIYVDYYLVLSKSNECVHVQSMTRRDDHVAFRTQAERMIKSFQFGPAEGEGRARSKPATPSRPSPPPP